jgi:hypothetical protein
VGVAVLCLADEFEYVPAATMLLVTALKNNSNVSVPASEPARVQA